MRTASALAAASLTLCLAGARAAPLADPPALGAGQDILQESGEVTVNGGPMTVTRYTWRDSQGHVRSASLVPASGSTAGYAVQFTYEKPGGVVHVNADPAGDGGFGYFVSHELYRTFNDGVTPDGTIAGLRGEDDSPFGRSLPSTGAAQSVSASQAVQEFRLDYPHWGTKAAIPSPSSTQISPDLSTHQKFDLPVVIRWTFIAGQDYPLWSLDYDLTTAADHISIDVRGPYGVMNFNESAGPAVTSINWGDAYLFAANGDGTELVAQDQAGTLTWNWTVPNPGRRFNVLGAGNYELGVVDTVTYAHSRYGDGYAFNRKKTSATRDAGCGDSFFVVLPCEWEWAYQSFQFDPGPPARPKLGWGSAPLLGSSEPLAYIDIANDTEPLVGVKGHIYYALQVVMGRQGANGTLTHSRASAADDPDALLTVQRAPSDGGSVSYTVLGDANGPYTDAGRTLAAWSSVALTATPVGGFTFNGWSGACAGVAGTVCIIAMDQAHTVTANFTGGVAPAQLSMAPASLDFGGQSMSTTSPAQAVTLTNVGAGTLTFSGISTGAPFAQTNNCASLAPAASCTVQVTFSPPILAGALNSATPQGGTLTITHDAAGSPSSVTLAGSAEKSLVSHYYRAILRRAPDDAGKAFWQSESLRMANAGADVNESWFALAMTFFASPEYAAIGRDSTGYVQDLYKTFFNRDADAGGLTFWTGQLQAGMPRETVLVGFMFSAEFQAFTQAIFGGPTAGPEVDLTMDFYRGLLSRLPDSAGFAFFLQQMRAAQCQGAAAVRAQAESMSQQFAGSAEYANRHRSNAQFVSDLYNAVLRRGADLAGVTFWIQQLDTGALSRESVRATFVASTEFTNRVNAIVARGCQP